MLVELDIKNFAIIKSLKVRFQEKMTVIIGETGAGKSIIIDAVSLLMGGRGQKEMIRSGENKAVITGLFELDEQKEKIAQLCDQYGLPHDDDQLVISRELAVKGRNVVRINGQLTTINVLRDLGHYLVDIHGQHDQQILMDQDRQIDLVDNYAPASFKDDLADYQADFEKWQKLTRQLRHLRQDAQELAQKQDILQFQNNELESADLEDPEEDEKLEEEYNELNNYQKIADTANYFMQLYDDDEHGIATLLGDAQNAATDLTEFGSKFKDFAKKVSGQEIKINLDIAGGNTNVDPLKKIVENNIEKIKNDMNINFPICIEYKNVKTFYGECIPKRKKLIFSLKLAKYDPIFIYYVIYHELTHFYYSNHQDDFYNLIESKFPNCKKIQHELRKIKYTDRY